VEPSPSTPQPPPDIGRELTLSDVARVMLARWKTMLSIVIAMTVVALAWALHSALYRGEGILQMPTVSLSDFKRYSIPLLDGHAFVAFLGTRKDFTPYEIEQIRSLLPTGDGVAPWVRPAFGFIKVDVKDLPDSAKIENQLVGAEIQVEARDADLALKLAQAVGDYVGDAVIRGRILDFVGTNLNDSRMALGKLENESLQNDFLLAQTQKKLAEMRDIQRRYPDASHDNPRQVVSLEKGGARYFSPVTQLVGVESYIVEINETSRKLARDREKLETDLAFFTLARKEVDKAPLGRQKLGLLENALAEVSRTNNAAPDAVRESLNTAELNIGQIRYLSNDALRFVSAPVIRKPFYGRIVSIAAAVVVAGVLLAGLISLALAWAEGLHVPKSETSDS
jgi:hypothetical protein